jgi:hypothetical protein
LLTIVANVALFKVLKKSPVLPVPLPSEA